MRIPPFHWWRTVFFLIPAISVYTIILGTLSLTSSLFQSNGHFAHWCARAWAWLILATTGVRVTVTGRERLAPDGAYIFVSNHQSIYDIPVIFASMPYQLRIIAKDSLGSFPFLGWHLKRTGHVLVDRKRPDRAAILKQWKHLIENGLSLIIFPEGTRSADGAVAPFKGLGILLAIEAGVTLAPLTVRGSRHVMLKGRLMTCPGAVELVIHEPVPTTGLTIKDARALSERLRDIVASAADGPASAAPDAADRPIAPAPNAVPGSHGLAT